MNENAHLLRRYAAERSEEAFAELVRRQVVLVYSAAFRLANGDVHRAQDVTPGMVYVGGDDNGRWVPELINDTSDGEHHIVITQNCLADGR
jgi:hypothetical protein